MFIWEAVLLRPIYNLLILIYTYVPGQDLGVAIIILTVLVKLVLFPLNRKAIISQRALQKIQPELEALKTKHKDDREKLSADMMALYRREGINPLSSCLPLLIQIPLLIAVFQVFVRGLGNTGTELLYAWAPHPEALQTIAFGFLDLSQKNYILAGLAGIAQFWQTKMLMNKREQAGSMASAMNKQMLYLMPIMTIWIGSIFPAGLALYWLATTLLSVAQQAWMIRKKEIAVDTSSK